MLVHDLGGSDCFKGLHLPESFSMRQLMTIILTSRFPISRLSRKVKDEMQHCKDAIQCRNLLIIVSRVIDKG